MRSRISKYLNVIFRDSSKTKKDLTEPVDDRRQRVMRSQSTPCEFNPSCYQFILFLIHEGGAVWVFFGEGNDVDLKRK